MLTSFTGNACVKVTNTGVFLVLVAWLFSKNSYCIYLKEEQCFVHRFFYGFVGVFSDTVSWSIHIKERFLGVPFYFHVHYILEYSDLAFLITLFLTIMFVTGFCLFVSLFLLTLWALQCCKDSAESHFHMEFLIRLPWLILLGSVCLSILQNLFSKNLFIYLFYLSRSLQFKFPPVWSFYDGTVVSQLNYNLCHSSTILQQSQLCSAPEYEKDI